MDDGECVDASFEVEDGAVCMVTAWQAHKKCPDSNCWESTLDVWVRQLHLEGSGLDMLKLCELSSGARITATVEAVSACSKLNSYNIPTDVLCSLFQ